MCQCICLIERAGLGQVETERPFIEWHLPPVIRESRGRSEKPFAPRYPNRYIVSVLIFDRGFERFKSFPERRRGQIMGFTPRSRRRCQLGDRSDVNCCLDFLRNHSHRAIRSRRSNRGVFRADYPIRRRACRHALRAQPGGERSRTASRKRCRPRHRERRTRRGRIQVASRGRPRLLPHTPASSGRPGVCDPLLSFGSSRSRDHREHEQDFAILGRRAWQYPTSRSRRHRRRAEWHLASRAAL